MACGLNEDHVIRHYDITGKECQDTMLNMKMRGKNLKKM